MKKLFFLFLLAPLFLGSCSQSDSTDNTNDGRDTIQSSVDQATIDMQAGIFRNKPGNFKIMFPGTPTETLDTVATDVGIINFHTFMYEESLDLAYMVVYGDYPASHIAATPIDTLLKNSKEGAINGMELLNLDSQEELDISGYKGLGFSANNGSFYVQYQIYLVNNRLYQLGTIKNESYLPEDKSSAFFSSFALLETGK